MKKNFETETWLDNTKLPLNPFVQETLANMIMSLLKTLKEAELSPRTMEVKIKRLAKPIDVDAHTYP